MPHAEPAFLDDVRQLLRETDRDYLKSRDVARLLDLEPTQANRARCGKALSHLAEEGAVEPWRRTNPSTPTVYEVTV